MPNKKPCTICKVVKPLTEFNKKSNRKDGLQLHCKECNRLRSRAYYNANREEHKQVTIARKKEIVKGSRAFVYDYLLSHPCIDCGEKDPVVLEFDHVRGHKRNTISHMVRAGCSITNIKAEIDKCDVRCANCHRRKTAIDFEWYKDL